MREYVKLLQKKYRNLQDPTILRRLRRKFPKGKFPWIEHFYALDGKIPRRRYLSANPIGIAIPADTSSDDDQTRFAISEPSDWSIPDITARVIQARFHKETSKQFALLKIKNLIK
jgi:hypothetical protein